MQQKQFSSEIDDLLIFLHCLFLFIYFSIFISRNVISSWIRPDIIDLTKFNILTCIHSFLHKGMFLTNAGWIKKFVNSVLNHLFNSQNKPFAIGPGMYTIQMCYLRQSPEFNLVKLLLTSMHEIILCLNLLLSFGLFLNIQSTQYNL